jgi:hypothetical protein
MTTPVIRTFSRDIEARFPDEGTVPMELREWWIETRENLERLKDKITSLTTENESLKTQVASLVSPQNQFTDAQALQLARFIQFWEIASDGSLIPYTHNASDLGSAERKVRDIYEAI